MDSEFAMRFFWPHAAVQRNMVIACCLPCRNTSAIPVPVSPPPIGAYFGSSPSSIAPTCRTPAWREEGCIDVRPKILYSAQRASYELGQGGKCPKATLVELISR